MIARSLTVAALCAASFSAQTRLDGVLDIHVHCHPDSRPRSIDAIDLARLAKARGMRGMVLKSHYEPTSSMAYLVRKEVPGLEVFGGIDLNRSVGGLNPEAVERMAKIKSGWGRVVWMPTFDSENEVRHSKENRPFVPVARDGRLLPETKQVIVVVARLGLTLETGHSSAAEALLIIREARAQGVRRIVVTHAMLAPVNMSVTQMKEAAGLGAYLEYVYNGLVGAKPEYTMRQYADAIRAVGPKYCILASDLGQDTNPLHPDGLAAFFSGLRREGISVADIDLMSKTNPALALGLE